MKSNHRKLLKRKRLLKVNLKLQWQHQLRHQLRHLKKQNLRRKSQLLQHRHLNLLWQHLLHLQSKRKLKSHQSLPKKLLLLQFHLQLQRRLKSHQNLLKKTHLLLKMKQKQLWQLQLKPLHLLNKMLKKRQFLLKRSRTRRKMQYKVNKLKNQWKLK